MIKGAVKYVGAKAIGHIAWAALRTALFRAASTIAAAGGPVGFFIGLGIATIGTLAELGMMFWDKWSREKRTKDKKKFDDELTHGNEASERLLKLSGTISRAKKLYGTKGFLRDNFELFTLFGKDGKTLKHGLDSGTIDKKWIEELIASIKSGKVDIEKE